MTEHEKDDHPATPPPTPPAGRPAIEPPTLMQTVFSVLASFFGVQNARNRERDFTSGKPLVFIAVAIVLTLLFVLTLVGIVHVLLRGTGL